MSESIDRLYGYKVINQGITPEETKRLLRRNTCFGSPYRGELILEAIKTESNESLEKNIPFRKRNGSGKINRNYLFWIKRIKFLPEFKTTINNTTYAWREKIHKIRYSCEQLVKNGFLKKISEGVNTYYYLDLEEKEK